MRSGSGCVWASRQRIAEVEGALAKMDETIARHKQKTLPQLWNALSALRVLPVLHADYDAKLERQGKRSHVLDRVRDWFDSAL